MDFNTVPQEDRLVINPYATKKDGEWVEGYTSLEFLEQHFGGLSKSEIYEKAKISEGLTLYFKWLEEQGILN